MRGECGAQLETAPGRYAACRLMVVNHVGRDHSDLCGKTWPACSQLCARNHVHGRYRTKAGINVGPRTLAARTPKRAKPSKGKRQQCSICLAAADLDADGKCEDRETCEATSPALFPVQT